MPAEQREIRERQRVVRAVGALADAHAPVHGRSLRTRVDARRGPDVGCRNARNLFGPFGGLVRQVRYIGVVAFGARRDECLVGQALADNHICHRVEQGRIGAGPVPEPEFCKPRHLRLPGIGYDQPRTVPLHGLLQEGRDDGMGFGRVRADHHEAFEVAHFGDRVAHRARAEGQLQAGDAACMAQARAVIDVVGPDHAADVLLEEVVVFVGGLGARVRCDAVGSVKASQAEKPVCHYGQRLIPRHLSPILRTRSRRAMSGLL